MISKFTRYFLSNCFAAKHHLSLAETDPCVYNIIENSAQNGPFIDFTETPTSLAVMQSLGSMISTKYASGYPGQKNKPGTEIYDQIEILCQQRALEAFSLNGKEYHVNVQLQSINAAKFVVSKALVNPGGKIIVLGDLDTQCLQKYFAISNDIISAQDAELIIVNDNRQLDDIQQLRISHDIPILFDVSDTAPYFMSKILHQNQLEKCDIIVSKTDSFLGPKGCLLFCKNKYQAAIDEACYPGYQSGPHFHTITGITVALEEVKSQEFTQFFHQVKGNCAALKRQLKLKEFPVIETNNINVSIEATKELQQKLFEADILAKLCESKIDFNLIPLSYRGLKQEMVPKLAEILGLALYQSIHGNFLKDYNNTLWKQELKNAKEEFIRSF